MCHRFAAVCLWGGEKGRDCGHLLPSLSFPNHYPLPCLLSASGANASPPAGLEATSGRGIRDRPCPVGETLKKEPGAVMVTCNIPDRVSCCREKGNCPLQFPASTDYG